MNGKPARLIKQLISFALVAGFGITVDLVLFTVLTAVGLTSGISNLVSASCSVIVVYLFSTDHVFRVRRSRMQGLAFVAWYATSILGFSLLVQLLVSELDINGLSAKLLSIPLSFFANFFAIRYLFRKGEAK